MLFMNDYDIAQTRYIAQHDDLPQTLRAVDVLDRLREWADNNSDGWAYWPKPVRAAKGLIELLNAVTTQAYRGTPQDLTAAEVDRALRPVKAFLTRQGVDHAEVI